MSILRSSVTFLVLLTAIAIPVHATVTTIGDVDPGGATDPWVVGGTLIVGDGGAGTLNVTDGGVVANFNQSNMTFADGDFNDDGIVDVADLGILGANWSASQSTGNASALVPEPTTLSLLAMSVLLVGRRRVKGS